MGVFDLLRRNKKYKIVAKPIGAKKGYQAVEGFENINFPLKFEEFVDDYEPEPGYRYKLMQVLPNGRVKKIWSRAYKGEDEEDEDEKTEKSSLEKDVKELKNVVSELKEDRRITSEDIIFSIVADEVEKTADLPLRERIAKIFGSGSNNGMEGFKSDITFKGELDPKWHPAFVRSWMQIIRSEGSGIVGDIAETAGKKFRLGLEGETSQENQLSSGQSEMEEGEREGNQGSEEVNIDVKNPGILDRIRNEGLLGTSGAETEKRTETETEPETEPESEAKSEAESVTKEEGG